MRSVRRASASAARVSASHTAWKAWDPWASTRNAAAASHSGEVANRARRAVWGGRLSVSRMSRG
ncbi:hypothetical protein GCM10027067_04130 [Pseudactinotalea suaedae]